MRGRLSMPTSVSAGTGEICMTISCVCLYDNPIVEPKGHEAKRGDRAAGTLATGNH